MFFKNLIFGLVLSLPSAFVFYIIIKITKQMDVYLFSLVLIIGLPWNLIIFSLLYILIYIFGSLSKEVQFFTEFNVSEWSLLIWLIIISCILGAHINGYFLIRKYNKSNLIIPKRC